MRLTAGQSEGAAGGRTKEEGQPENDPEQEFTEISLLRRSQEPPSPCGGKVEAQPIDDQAAYEGLGANAFAIEDLFGLGDAA